MHGLEYYVRLRFFESDLYINHVNTMQFYNCSYTYCVPTLFTRHSIKLYYYVVLLFLVFVRETDRPLYSYLDNAVQLYSKKLSFAFFFKYLVF